MTLHVTMILFRFGKDMKIFMLINLVPATEDRGKLLKTVILYLSHLSGKQQRLLGELNKEILKYN